MSSTTTTTKTGTSGQQDSGGGTGQTASKPDGVPKVLTRNLIPLLTRGLDASDALEIYALMRSAPLHGIANSTLRVQKTSIGIRYRPENSLHAKESVEMTLEYGPQRLGPALNDEAMPLIQVEETSSSFIAWDNVGKVYYTTKIVKEQYVSSYYMASMTGAVLDTILEQSIDYAERRRRYQPFAVYTTEGKQLRSSSSTDFVRFVWQRLANLGVEIQPILSPPVYEARLWVHSWERMTPEPPVASAAANFYQRMYQCLEAIATNDYTAWMPTSQPTISPSPTQLPTPLSIEQPPPPSEEESVNDLELNDQKPQGSVIRGVPTTPVPQHATIPTSPPATTKKNYTATTPSPTSQNRDGETPLPASAPSTAMPQGSTPTTTKPTKKPTPTPKQDKKVDPDDQGGLNDEGNRRYTNRVRILEQQKTDLAKDETTPANTTALDDDFVFEAGNNDDLFDSKEEEDEDDDDSLQDDNSNSTMIDGEQNDVVPPETPQIETPPPTNSPTMTKLPTSQSPTPEAQDVEKAQQAAEQAQKAANEAKNAAQTEGENKAADAAQAAADAAKAAADATTNAAGQAAMDGILNGDSQTMTSIINTCFTNPQYGIVTTDENGFRNTNVYLYRDGSLYYKLNLTSPYLEVVKVSRALPKPVLPIDGGSGGDFLDWFLAICVLCSVGFMVVAILQQMNIRLIEPLFTCQRWFFNPRKYDYEGDVLFQHGQHSPLVFGEDAIPLSMGGRRTNESPIRWKDVKTSSMNDQDMQSWLPDFSSPDQNLTTPESKKSSNHSHKKSSTHDDLGDFELSNIPSGRKAISPRNLDSPDHSFSGDDDTSPQGLDAADGGVIPQRLMRDPDLVDLPCLRSNSKVAVPVGSTENIRTLSDNSSVFSNGSGY